MNAEQTPIHSYAEANRELLEAFCRYLVTHGQAAPTIRSYRDSVSRLVESLGSESIVNVERSKIRIVLANLYGKGLADNSIRLHTAALRNFFKYLRFTGLTKHDPTLLIAHRKVPGRLPIVLSVEQVEALIAAASDPFERAVSELLYSTGVRVSELVKLELENVDLPGHKILVKKGKGGKDRYVVFGSYAEKALRDYLGWRRHETGYLFEAPARRGSVIAVGPSWVGHYYESGVLKQIHIGERDPLRKSKAGRPIDVSLLGTSQAITREVARAELDRFLERIPGFSILPARPYWPDSIRGVLNRLAHRAGIAHVHPHSIRRSMACHMLASGADLRAIQELLGHERLGTTMLYTHLTAEELKKTHERCHPHEQQTGGIDHEEK